MKLKRQVRLVNSKKACTCAETALPIERGQLCLFDPLTRLVFHPKSQRFREFEFLQKRNESTQTQTPASHERKNQTVPQE